jgi:pimeloyl-ACP methyl ester carboxylesterase
MRDLASPDVLRRVVRETEFFRTRMQPIAGAIGCVSSQRYPRYSYYPYVPVNFDEDQADAATLIVAVHGSSRNAIAQRDNFSRFAEETGCFVLAPLFPIDFSTEVPDEEYKYVIGSRQRYDLILFDLIEEFERLARVCFGQILLFGFSGGGQFAHRIMYLHPERFAAVSVGAPGFITRLNENHDWWVGIRDVEARTGSPVNMDALRRLPVHLVCGESDDIPFEIYSREEMGLSEREYEEYGRDRVVRLRVLERDFRAAGLNVEVDFVAGESHDPGGLMKVVCEFFRPFTSRMPENIRRRAP